MSGAPEVSWTEVVRVLAAAHGLTDPMDNDAVECVLWNETPYPVGSVKDVVRSLNDLFEFLASPEPRGEHGGRSTCPQCGRRWWVTPLDDCLVPACGCYGTDTGADNPERPCHRCGLAHATSCEHMPARSARPQPTEGTTPAELVQVGWGGCVGHSTCEVDEGHEWYLRPLDDKHELDRTHPIWPVYALRAVPGAVAGEPECTPAAELPFRSYPEFLRRFLPEEAERRRRAGMTPSEVAQEIGREAAAEALAAFTRAADTQEAHDA